MAGGTPPLRLKDLLELDCDSCSAAGFRCYPRRLGESAPMRHLLESSPSLRRRPGKLSHLSRTLSRRLSRGGFWRRRDEDDDDAAATPEPAPACTGCGSSSSEELDTASESSDNSSVRTGRRRSRSESDSDFSSATEDSVHHPSLAAAAAAAGHEHEHEVAMKRASKEGSTSGSEADDKDQLSPVAVMDFPFDDDDCCGGEDTGVACSPSFSLSRLQRGKIRRFGSRDELKPMDLETLLAATSDADDAPAPQVIQRRTEGAATPGCASSGRRGAGVHDEDDGIISLLMGKSSAGGVDDVSQRLLLDFFVEMKRRRSEAAHAGAELTALAARVRLRKAERLVDGEAVAAARGWLEGTGSERWGLNDVLSAGAAIVAEMERGRRWMQVGEEEREVGAVVAAMLADQLVDELLRCLHV